MKNAFWDEQMLAGVPQSFAEQHRERESYHQWEQKLSDKKQELKVSNTLYAEYVHELKQVEAELQSAQLQQKSLNTQAAELKQTLADTETVWKQQQDDVAGHNLLFRWEFDRRKRFYQNFLKGQYEESQQIAELFKDRHFKGVIVYPAAVQWQPVQRPQQFLMEHARKGWLCFFCTSNPGDFQLEEIEENLYLVNREEFLLPALKSVHVLVLNTWLMQNAWIECLPNKTIWYDILDRVDFFSLYDKGMLVKHYEVLKQAAIVTYSARDLQEFAVFRQDAVYLPNAARWEDFAQKTKPRSPAEAPKELRKILRSKRKILGYFGAIEEWFDKTFIHNLVRDKNVEVVCIGHVNISTDDFGDRVHFLGPKPYTSLVQYAAWFDALLIPFAVNDLTHAVSPVKFFEYCALGKPILSSGIREVKPYAGPGVHIVENSAASFNLQSVWKQPASAYRNRLLKIAQENSWRRRVETVEAALMRRADAASVFANKTYDRSIGVFSATFFDYEGQNFFSGGAERYLIDLHEVCEELGYKLEIYQYGNFPWYRKYKDIDVYSLGENDIHMNQPFTMKLLEDYNDNYVSWAEGRMHLNLYSAFFQAYPTAVHPSVGISHGVAWDNENSRYQNGDQFWASNRRFIEGARNVQQLISVDTNTPNWLQTVDYETAQRSVTIPNYVDPAEFYPVARKSDKIRIVYPRRLYAARGLYLTLDIVDEILQDYEEAEFHFIGKGFEDDVRAVDEMCERWPGRVFRYHKDPEDMHEVYKKADIVLIPTLYSEGTSLSCLEACASGNAVIATRIGGLCDIIINDFNGRLISPNREDLLKAVRELVEQPKLRERLAANAIAVAQAFSKQQWKEHWKQVFVKAIGETDEPVSKKSRKSVELRVKSQTDLQEHAETVNRLLAEGYEVFIRCAESADVARSFGRLQWLHQEEELAFEPDELLELKV